MNNFEKYNELGILLHLYILYMAVPNVQVKEKGWNRLKDSSRNVVISYKYASI